MCCGGGRLCGRGSGTFFGDTWCGSRRLCGSWNGTLSGSETWCGSERLCGSRSETLLGSEMGCRLCRSRGGTIFGSGRLCGSWGGTLLGTEIWCRSGRLWGSQGGTLFGTEMLCGSRRLRGSRRGSGRLLGSQLLFATVPAWHWWRNNSCYCQGSRWGSFSNRGIIWPSYSCSSPLPLCGRLRSRLSRLRVSWHVCRLCCGSPHIW